MTQLIVGALVLTVSCSAAAAQAPGPGQMCCVVSVPPCAQLASARVRFILPSGWRAHRRSPRWRGCDYLVGVLRVERQGHHRTASISLRAVNPGKVSSTVRRGSTRVRVPPSHTGFRSTGTGGRPDLSVQVGDASLTITIAAKSDVDRAALSLTIARSLRIVGLETSRPAKRTKKAAPRSK